MPKKEKPQSFMDRVKEKLCRMFRCDELCEEQEPGLIVITFGNAKRK